MAEAHRCYPLVFFAYAIVTTDSAILFVDESQLTEESRSLLTDAVQIKPYDTFFQYLKVIPEKLSLSQESVCVLPMFMSPVHHDLILLSRTQPILLGDKSSLAVSNAIGKVYPYICMNTTAS